MQVRAWFTVVTALAALTVLRSTSAAEPRRFRAREMPLGISSYALAQSQGRLLWVGQRSGLLRFDGVRASAIGAAATVAPRDVRVLAPLGGDEVWFGRGRTLLRLRATAPFFDVDVDDVGQPGLARASGDRIEHLSDDVVTALAPAGDGAMWVGTTRGVLRMRGAHVERQVTQGLPSTQVTALAALPDGGLLVGTTAGAVELAGADVRALPVRDPITAAAITAEGDRLLGTVRGLVRLAVAGRVQRFDRGVALPDGEVRAIAPHPGVGVWVGTSAGLSLLRGDEAEPELPGPHVTDVLVDHEGGVWVATRDAAVVRLERQSIENVGPGEGLAGSTAHAVLGARDGAVWIAGNRGLTRWSATGVTTLRAGQELPEGHPGPLAEDARGGIWTALREGPLLRVELRRGAPHVETVGAPVLADERPIALAADAGGTVWVGTRAGTLHEVRDDGRGVWRVSARHDAASGLCAGPVLQVVPRRAGGSWLVQDAAGIATFDAGRGTCLGPDPGGPVAALLEDDDGTLWLGLRRDGGLVRRKGQSRIAFDERSGLYCDDIFAIADDRRGHLWTACGGGAQRLDRAALERPADGIMNGVVSVVGTDGFRSQESSFGAHPVATFGPDGRFWIAMLAGAAAVDPAFADRRFEPVEPRIEGVTVDGRPLPVGGPIRTRIGAAASLSVAVVAPRFTAPDRIVLQQKLEPVETEWRTVWPDAIGVYPRLAPGAYRYAVRALALRGDAAPKEATVVLELAPPLHQTGWFRGGLFALAVLGVLVVHRLKVARERAAHRSALEERARIARDLHDTLGQGFATVGLQLALTRQRLGSAEAPRLLEETVTMLERCQEDVKASIFALRRAGEPEVLPSLDEELRRAAPLAAHAGATLTLRSEAPTPPQLPGHVAHELPLFVREALANALRHGNPRHVTVTLAGDASALEVRIDDDGTGFPADVPGPDRGHFGLVSLRERARRMGARVAFGSSHQGGASVTLTIPTRRKEARP